MKKIIPPILALVCTMILFSCGKETQSSTQGGGICKIRYTITPSLSGKSKLNGIEQAHSFTSVTPIVLIQWVGTITTTLSSIESPEFSVTKGQNVTIGSTSINSYDNTCRSVKIECIVNNKTVNSFIKELGYLSNTPLTPCKDNSNSSVNFIIP